MKKVTQKENNPFAFSDTNKRYHTYEYYLRRTFGRRCAKLPLDAGFTCPNIDGRHGVGGCIYCSGRGSGDFAPPPGLGIAAQIAAGRASLGGRKRDTGGIIPYFQAHSNTYAPLAVLREVFEEALAEPGVVGLNIATRADCLEEDTLEHLAGLSRRTVLTVELGLQTIHDKTAALINRGHSYREFLEGYRRLRSAGEGINICLHMILGLPGEDDGMMGESFREVARLRPGQVKIHLLHVLRSTPLEAMYRRGEYDPLGRERYISLVVRALELLPGETVIARLTGDGPIADLIAPAWSARKLSIINDIDKELYRLSTYQGRRYRP